jgi:hypothetical protein
MLVGIEKGSFGRLCEGLVPGVVQPAPMCYIEACGNFASVLPGDIQL